MRDRGTNRNAELDLAAATGGRETASRAADLAAGLPDGLKPLAPVAYNYVWSWLPGGEDVFREINPHRWELSGGNPVKFLSDLWPSTLRNAEADTVLKRRVRDLAETVETTLQSPPTPGPRMDAPIAYMCAEYGVHESIPTYSGGLGVLAGDTLKEASDQGLSLVAIGLLYRRGYHRQRLDASGRQLEYWVTNDPKSLPMARVTVGGEPVKLAVEIFGKTTWFQVWRVDVGRVPLLLLDAEVPENDQVQRWYTARLYDGNRAIRLAQYALLGIGGVRTLRALGIEPQVYHLNEGHPALAALELAAHEVAAGASFEAAIELVRSRFVFTTHTPVPAGNETYAVDEVLAAVSELADRLGIDHTTFAGLFRTHPGSDEEPLGMTQLAIRMSSRRNAVSSVHEKVARRMWQPLFSAPGEDAVPITHVTNGIHLPTFLSPPFRRLYDRYLGRNWSSRTADSATWSPVLEIPDAELWAARNEAREQLIEYVRRKSELDRLQRGEPIDYVRAAAHALDTEALTLGFARRLASYKRAYLLSYDADRLVRILEGFPPVQLLIAGKAHPLDEEGKEALRDLFELKRQSRRLGERVVVLEDYDLRIGRELVAGCDVWLNLPRRPLEASGTSGMKASVNGALQVSILDGWWAEAYNGRNGWAISQGLPADLDRAEVDAADAASLYDLLEGQVIPLFYDRAGDDVPHGWCTMVKEAIVSCAPRFTASRMLAEYASRMYAPDAAIAAAGSL